MANWLDLIYATGLSLSSPAWAVTRKSREKVLGALRDRTAKHLKQIAEKTSGNTKPSVLIHAVSLGEVNAARELIAGLQQKAPDWNVLLTTTTTAGWERAHQLYGGKQGVIIERFPLDFSWACRRLLKAYGVRVAVMMELEVWPNFVAVCRQLGVCSVVVNGRLTEESFKKYRWGGAVVRSMMRGVNVICAQDETYAQRFQKLGGVDVRVTGNMKFDTALAFDEAAAARAGEALHAAVWDESWNRKFGSRGPVLLLGSSGPGEEKMMLDLYRQLLCEYPTLRLAIVPRKPERFDEVRMLISESGFAVFSRSSGVVTGPMGRSAESERAVGAAVVLGDTMGELRSFYAMADVVVVGRTLVDLGQRQHGSDMIEPAALGKAVIVGRYTGNFAGAMSAFRSAGAMIEVNDEHELGVQVRGLLNDANKRTALGQLARDVARASRGATSRHLEVIFRLMKQAEPTWQPPETSGR